jgi:hypothetical protein
LRRLNRHRFNNQGQIVLDLEDTISLLTFQREEKFEGERAIRLFQFRTWILFPDTQQENSAKWAETISAVKYLDRIEENYFADEESARLRDRDENPSVNLNDKPDQTVKIIQNFRTRNTTYRQLYDQFIGRRGGALEILYTPSPPDFDKAIKDRIEYLDIVANLVEYRLRYTQHEDAVPKASRSSDLLNSSHAMFFYWWPTHAIEGRRGKTPINKSVHPRTMGDWFGKMEYSAIFIYLIQRHGFGQQIPTETADDFFIDDLIRSSKEKSELIRFFGTYAYVAEMLKKSDCDLVYVRIPEAIPRIPISTDPFTAEELKTISDYEPNYLKMKY